MNNTTQQLMNRKLIKTKRSQTAIALLYINNENNMYKEIFELINNISIHMEHTKLLP